VRIRIIQAPTRESIDGIRLDRFLWGFQYDVSAVLGSYLMAEGWAELTTGAEPALVTPLSEFEPDSHSGPPNLSREIFPPYFDGLQSVAMDRAPRRSRRRKRASD